MMCCVLEREKGRVEWREKALGGNGQRGVCVCVCVCVCV